jgi:hypothetical protein
MNRFACCTLIALVAAGCSSSTSLPEIGSTSEALHGERIHHALLVSVDGLHAVDLANYVASHPGSTLAALSSRGLTFTQASSARPSDSFPGLLAMVTGGSPKSTGVYYDDSYDRALSPPGSDCSIVGTEVVFDESIDKDPTRLDAGGGIDESLLPRDPARGCAPVYPHEFLRVDTIFEVVRAAGGRTAWADKHPAYDLVNGPSGRGVDDLYTPEIAAGGDSTPAAALAYDELKVQAILNELGGKDHAGLHRVGVPALLGMNFQAVSVAQKATGYGDVLGTPNGDVAAALDYVDGALGRFAGALYANGLAQRTLFVVSAKHGQSSIDPGARAIVDKKLLASIANGAAPVAQLTADDVALLWLADSTKAPAVAAALAAHRADAAIDQIYAGASLALRYGDPARDSRVPDLIVQPRAGVIYTKPSATKVAEHGGFAEDDTHVALLLAHPGLPGWSVDAPVTTAQIAPTILRALGLDPDRLDAVFLEQTQALPGWQ